MIDQSAEAREAGLELRDTALVIFGSPAARTVVALGDGAVSPRALDRAFKSSAGRVGASLQGDEEDGCGRDGAVQDRGRRNVYRWGLWQGESRRPGEWALSMSPISAPGLAAPFAGRYRGALTPHG